MALRGLTSREAQALMLRVDIAEERFGPPVDHVNNGEENEYRANGDFSYIANYSKGLPHNEVGEVVPGDYRKMLRALATGDPDDFERIPLGTPLPITAAGPGRRKLTNPQSGLAFDLEGPDVQAVSMSPAPRIASAENAAEMAELYWMALLRDVPFSEFETNADVAEAASSLSSRFSDFRGPRSKGGRVTPGTLFRGVTAGDLAGPYVSQFLLRGNRYPGLGLTEADGQIRYGTLRIEQKQSTAAPGRDFLVDFGEWLAVRNGADTAGGETFDPSPRFIRSLRDLATYAHFDHLYQAYSNACLMLLQLQVPGVGTTGAPLDAGNHYTRSANQAGFGTFGAPHVLSLLGEVAIRALRAVWFQKWFVHRRLRPEEYGGLVDLHARGERTYPLSPEILDTTPGSILDRVRSHNRRTNGADSYLLPQAYSEGCPTHPSYGAGHASVAGACVTVLKAWFDESFELSETFVPDAAGERLVACGGPQGGGLRVGGELNKLAANIAMGLNAAGVHWRSDYAESLKLGEAVAIGIMRDQKRTYNEPSSFTFTKFDGTRVTI